MIRRLIRRLRSEGGELRSTVHDGEVREFGDNLLDAVPKMYATFFYYWEKDRIAAVFILYSLGFSILLAAMTVYVENFSMISKAAGIYSISTVVFVYWVGKEFEEGRLDPEVLQPAEPDSDDANDEDR